MDKLIGALSGQMAAAQSTLPARAGGGDAFKSILSSQQDLRKEESAGTQKVLVGEITSEKRTVSELLMEHDQLKQSTWDILSFEQNRGKEYTKLQSGTRIYYNPSEGTLSWSGQPGRATSGSRPPALPVGAVQQPGGLLRAPSTTGVDLGMITKDKPTVSHLLKAHPALAEETWNIISSPVNNGKEFDKIPLGAAVHIDPVTHEVGWTAEGGGRSLAADFPDLPHVQNAGQQTTGPVEMKAAGAGVERAAELVVLGKIDSANPTVSHLLMQHPELKKQAWELLSNNRNSEKPFRNMGAGTEVYFNPGSREITWKHTEQHQSAVVQVNAAAAPVNPTRAGEVTEASGRQPAGDLTEAVQPFLGAPYKDINCYELLVEGLRRMDIPYEGKGGLFSKLTRMAEDKGMPVNAYLNGEGIVKAAGALVLSRNYNSVGDWQEESYSLYSEMEPLLNKGQILSFSTERRGHTGIVSQQGSHWTFINSGRLDNAVTLTDVSKGVGEESLQKEIGNWFKLAHANGESLMVTLGRLEPQRVIAAYDQKDAFSKRI